MSRFPYHSYFAKLRWEFWPTRLFYFPIYIRILIDGFFLKSWTYFTIVNPKVEFSGLLNYSKWNILASLNKDFVPRGACFKQALSIEELEERAQKLQISYPFILKPDIGERGLGVAIIRNAGAGREYLATARYPLILQEFISYPEEYGLMFVRLPGAAQGRVSSIVHKVPLFVIGNGRDSLEDLILADRRSRLFYHKLKKQYRARWYEVPAPGTRIRLVEYGSHSRGATFYDANKLHCKELDDLVNKMIAGFPEFCIGRFDVLCKDFSSLLKGELSIVELNGVNSEPCHIYDPENNVFRAWSDLLSHWGTIARIAKIHFSNGMPKTNIRELIQAIKEHDKSVY